MKLREVIKAMKSTDQISGKQTVLQHGLSVRRKLTEILDFIEGKDSLKEPWVPTWLWDHKESLRKLILPRKSLRRYALWHDLGKPFCRLLDGD